MKELIKKLLRESLFKESVGETIEQFYNRFRRQNPNPDFLELNFKNPNFQLRLLNKGGVKRFEYHYAESNKCETNVFNFIKSNLHKGVQRYFPVSGWAFLDSTTYFEHFWVYDSITNLFLEITPFKDSELAYAYGGVINKNINDDILNANSYQDIEFLKGKTYNSLYKNYIQKDSSPKFEPDKIHLDDDERIFNYIENEPKYNELDSFIKNENINSKDELFTYIPKLNKLLGDVRNNREYNYLDNLIKQIKSFQ